MPSLNLRDPTIVFHAGFEDFFKYPLPGMPGVQWSAACANRSAGDLTGKMQTGRSVQVHPANRNALPQDVNNTGWTPGR